MSDGNEKDRVVALASSIDREERIFFPLLDADASRLRIAPHFGHAPFFGVYDTKKQELLLVKNRLDHQAALSPVDQLIRSFHPTMIFAKHIGDKALAVLQARKVAVMTGPYATVKDALLAYDDWQGLVDGCGGHPC